MCKCFLRQKTSPVPGMTALMLNTCGKTIGRAAFLDSRRQTWEHSLNSRASSLNASHSQYAVKELYLWMIYGANLGHLKHFSGFSPVLNLMWICVKFEPQGHSYRQMLGKFWLQELLPILQECYNNYWYSFYCFLDFKCIKVNLESHVHMHVLKHLEIACTVEVYF